MKISGSQNSIKEIIKLIDPKAKLAFDCICNDNTNTHKLICRDRSYIEANPDYSGCTFYETYEVEWKFTDGEVRLDKMEDCHVGNYNLLTGAIP